ncbi:MAG TPA: hypothetical protein VFV70_07135 [Hyphomonadaceae bacterium]|nr:hypothetical protein [Hyphomonadaceae bacterium]
MMRGKAALIGFLVVQAAMLIYWIGSLAPVMPTGSLVSDAQQVWSGGVFSNLTSTFRGYQGVSSATFEAAGPMLWGSGLIVLAGIVGWIGGGEFHKNRTVIAAGLAVAALGLAAGGAFFVVEQWSGDTAFKPPAVNVIVLYMATRTALVQLAVAWVVLALYAVLAIAGVSTPGKPLGYHLAVVNWAIVAIVWAALYLGVYAMPGLFGGA